MTSRTIRDHGKLSSIVISCDHMSCGVALNDTDIEKGGGLKAMGWQMAAGDGQLKHYCPIHNR